MIKDRGQKRVRVAHVLGDLGHGGAEMGVVRMIENFEDPRFDHCITVLGSDLGLKEATGTKIPCFAMARQGRDYTAFMALRSFFKDQAIDIVHVNNLGPWWDAALAARLAGCPCIETFHGVEQGRLTFSRPKRLLFQAAARLSREVTAVARPAAALAAELTGINIERIRVINNGIDTETFRPVTDGAEKGRLRRSLGLPEEGVLLGCIGALRTVKNHAGLISAFARAFSESSTKVHLVLVGGGALESDLKDLCRTLGIDDRVIFLGLRDDVLHILQTLDCFVLNSDTEGLSYAVLEAMACGLPVIATSVGGNPELVEDDVHGWLYDVGDQEKLTALLEEAVRDPKLLAACGTRAREKVRSAYSLDKMAQSYAHLYEEVLSLKGGSGTVWKG